MTGFAAVIEAIRRELLADGVVRDKQHVIPVARRDVPKMVGDFDILLRPKGFVSPTEIVQGAGRRSPVRRLLEVILRTRDARDEAGSDRVWLIEHFAKEEAILDSLQLFWPTDPDTGVEILVQPMRFVNSTDPSRDLEKASQQYHWGFSVIPFEIVYEPTMDQTVQ